MAATVKKTKKKIDFASEIQSTFNSIKTEPKTENKKINTNKESQKERKQFLIKFPPETYNGIEIAAKILCRGNKTKYINKLVEKDLKENLDAYKKFYDFKFNN